MKDEIYIYSYKKNNIKVGYKVLVPGKNDSRDYLQFYLSIGKEIYDSGPNDHRQYKLFKRNYKVSLHTAKKRAIKWRNKKYSKVKYTIKSRRQLPNYRIK